MFWNKEIVFPIICSISDEHTKSSINGTPSQSIRAYTTRNHEAAAHHAHLAHGHHANAIHHMAEAMKKHTEHSSTAKS